MSLQWKTDQYLFLFFHVNIEVRNKFLAMAKITNFKLDRGTICNKSIELIPVTVSHAQTGKQQDQNVLQL